VIFRTRHASLSCQELVELVTDYLEGALPRRERRLFDQHISACDGCSTYLDQMRATIELTGKLEPKSISPDAEAALLAAFADWKRA
jgi:anti-sigma factor RsiW